MKRTPWVTPWVIRMQRNQRGTTHNVMNRCANTHTHTHTHTHTWVRVSTDVAPEKQLKKTLWVTPRVIRVQ